MLGLQMREPATHALLRNTCSITRLEGSSKINVIPAEVHAELDCRLLPDQDPEAFLAELNTIINDEAITIEKIMGFTPAVSRTGTPLYDAIKEVSATALDAQVDHRSVAPVGPPGSGYIRQHSTSQYAQDNAATHIPCPYRAGRATSATWNSGHICCSPLWKAPSPPRCCR